MKIELLAIFHRQIEKFLPFFDVLQYSERENALFSPFFLIEFDELILFSEEGGVGVFYLSSPSYMSRRTLNRLNCTKITFGPWKTTLCLCEFETFSFCSIVFIFHMAFFNARIDTLNHICMNPNQKSFCKPSFCKGLLSLTCSFYQLIHGRTYTLIKKEIRYLQMDTPCRFSNIYRAE